MEKRIGGFFGGERNNLNGKVELKWFKEEKQKEGNLEGKRLK
jgi:hypothetical protein